VGAKVDVRVKVFKTGNRNAVTRYPAGAALSKKVPPVVVSVTVATIGDGVFRTTMSPPGAEWSNTRGGLNVIPLSCERQVHVLVSRRRWDPR
jgi:hypothetical protein